MAWINLVNCFANTVAYQSAGRGIAVASSDAMNWALGLKARCSSPSVARDSLRPQSATFSNVFPK